MTSAANGGWTMLRDEDEGRSSITEQRRRQLSDGAKRECSKTALLRCACSAFVV